MDIWVYNYHHESVMLVELGTWVVEDLVELFPDAIYFFAELVAI